MLLHSQEIALKGLLQTLGYKIISTYNPDEVILCQINEYISFIFKEREIEMICRKENLRTKIVISRCLTGDEVLSLKTSYDIVELSKKFYAEILLPAFDDEEVKKHKH